MSGTPSRGFARDAAARSALNTVRHFVGLLDADGILLEVNTAALEAGGLTRDDVVGLPFWEARWWTHDPAVAARLREAVTQAAEGATVRYPVQVLAGDQGRSLVTIDFTISPIREPDGSIAFLVPEGHPTGTVHRVDEDAASSLSSLVADGSAARTEARQLRDLAAGLAQAHTVDEVATVIIEQVPDIVGVSFCNVALRADDTTVKIHQPPDLDGDVMARWTEIPLDAATPATDAIRDGCAHVASVRGDLAERYPALADDVVTAGLETIAAVPVVDRTDRPMAAIGFGTTAPTDDIDLDRSKPILDLCGAAIQRAIVSQSESRLALLLDTLLRTAPIGLGFIDRDLRLTMVNDRLAELRPLDDGATAVDAEATADLPPDLVEHVRAVLRHGEAIEAVEISEPHGRSDERIWTASFYPVEEEPGSVAGVGLVVEDVTEQRRRESDLAALAARVRAALSASDGGVYEWHPPTGHVVWTAEYAELYGFDDDVEASFENWLERVHPGDRTTVTAEVEHFLVSDVDWRHEFRVVHPERGVLWVQSVADVERDHTGAATRVTGLNIDVTDRKRRELEIERRHREQRLLAQRLQNGLLPGNLPAVPGYGMVGQYAAGTDGLRIGGDWYDVVVVGDDDVALVVGDVVGHDLDAAVAMAQIRHALVGMSHTSDDPALILDDLDQLTSQRATLLATTLWYARLQPSTGELVFASAGHHAPVVVSSTGVVRPLAGGLGPPIGVARAGRSSERTSLAPGDRLIAFTDGLIERRVESIDVGRERLVAHCRRSYAAPLAEFVQSAMSDVADPLNDDDVAVLGVERVGD